MCQLCRAKLPAWPYYDTTRNVYFCDFRHWCAWLDDMASRHRTGGVI